MASFNWVDYIVLFIFFISLVGGFLRGGAREIVSLATWIAAFIVASLFAKPLAAYFSGTQLMQTASSAISNFTSQTSLFALAVSYCVLFFSTLLIGSIIGYLLNSIVESIGLGVINRVVGAIFGLGRGYLVNLVAIFIIQLTPIIEQPFWSQSSFVNAYQPAVVWLGNIVQPGLQSLKSTVGQTLQNWNSTLQNSATSILQNN